MMDGTNIYLLFTQNRFQHYLFFMKDKISAEATTISQNV